MAAVTYLNEYEAKQFERVEGDKDCDELLQEMNAKTGRRWLIQVTKRIISRGWFKHAEERKYYTLYLDCHGEYQVMNLVTPRGGSVFVGCGRDAVMNYMLGYLAGFPRPALPRHDHLKGAE